MTRKQKITLRVNILYLLFSESLLLPFFPVPLSRISKKVLKKVLKVHGSNKGIILSRTFRYKETSGYTKRLSGKTAVSAWMPERPQ